MVHSWQSVLILMVFVSLSMLLVYPVVNHPRSITILPALRTLVDQTKIEIKITKENIKENTELKIHRKTNITQYMKSWTGDCPFPNYASKLVNESWFPMFLDTLQKVDLKPTKNKRTTLHCTRWWHLTPQADYKDIPPRKLKWKEPTRPGKGFIRPNCTFGQDLIPWTKCSKAHNKLWRELDKIGAIYFPRSGSELGVVRGSSYLSSDGDVDIFVDIPQDKLYQMLQKVLKPSPHVDGSLKSQRAEIHWRVKGCAEIHLVFNEWMVDEMTKAGQSRPTHNSTCNCYMDSARLTCHKDAKNRMYAQYGPSWFVPLHAKYLDVPHLARGKSIHTKLNKLAPKDGLIHEKAIQKLDQKIVYTKDQMEMILAQLNVLYQLIKKGYR
ncbi:uncharacterized protein [Clytia hemisphaerica]|uniref:Uncharacterized protein n=1 Tax=Clytia hemisphaerica TaxID=252671 RepID=A0A7M6DQX8_9CNID